MSEAARNLVGGPSEGSGEAEDVVLRALRSLPAVGEVGSRLVFVADEDGRYVAVSRSVCDLLGYRLDELVGRPVTDVAVDPEAADEYALMVSSGALVGVATIRAKDGALFPLAYSAAEVVLDGQRLFVSVGTVAEDVPEAGPAREAQRRLRLVIADDHPPTRLLVRTLLEFVDGIEIVAEAEDGLQALASVMDLNPDLVLLDVHMPRLDGLSAAEAVRSFRPSTHVVLHTAQPDEGIRRQARNLGVPLLDKMRFDDVLAVLETSPDSRPVAVLPDARVEAAVLTALTARRSQPMFLVLPDGTVPFYNTLAAELLALPLPAEPTHIDALRSHFEILRPDRTPIAVHERLMYRAIDAREPLTEIVVVQAGDRETTCRAAAVPFFSADATHVTVAIYFEPFG